MKILSRLKGNLPKPFNVLLAVLSAFLLILAFPGFELWFTAWFALVPLFWAIEREKESWFSSLILGWVFGTIFFFGTTWWLTFAPITYAHIPAVIAYLLLFCAASVAGLFPGIFSALFSILLKRFGIYALLSAPFLWTAIEFLRFWTTGNNWNAIGYSQAFSGFALSYANVGGIFLVGFVLTVLNTGLVFVFLLLYKFSKLKKSRRQRIGYIFALIFSNSGFISGSANNQSGLFEKPPAPLYFDQKKMRKYGWRYKPNEKIRLLIVGFVFLPLIFFGVYLLFQNFFGIINVSSREITNKTLIIAIQPNVPMSGLDLNKWKYLRQRHVELAENALQKLENEGQRTNDKGQTIVIFPESPMNFMYARDREFQEFVGRFATENNVSVLFNSAEPIAAGEQFYNSAVMVNERGEKVVQYDKIHLMPFGEYLPLSELLGLIMPPLVGNFAFGEEYDLIPLGEAQAGIMICFESHFPDLSREFVSRGADVLIELTNDGYLGNTPVLRQHLANAVFRAVETNRPVLRVTNVGITAYINERGEVLDVADVYTEATRVWTVSESNGGQTFYVRFGDWFAWLCSVVSGGLLIFAFLKRKRLNEI